ncbi:META domain-containing protein [Flavicella sp.]|uniref:META domain-containing protein n=1 Tax=Flavicella sp. TaxID=2957742 RepID=UPI0030161C1E
MKQIKIISILIIIVMIQSCSIQKNTVFWVSGIKTECTSGAGEKLCLKIHKGKTLDNVTWEYFYSNIEGFEFEEGFLKKVEVKEEKLKNVPADGSSVKYTLVKELEKKVDVLAKVQGKWILNQINDNPIDENIKPPKIEITLNEMQIEGDNGCNNYSGPINKLTSTIIRFGNIITTQRACITKHIGREYYTLLNTVDTYQVKEGHLIFYDKNGNEILSYIKKSNDNAEVRLHDIWNVTRISGKAINRMSPTPRVEINLTKMKIYGNNGCNDYSGGIQKVTDTQIIFENIASTKKMCREMTIVNNFNSAMSKVSSYKLDKLKLILFDNNGEEVLAFLKGD